MKKFSFRLETLLKVRIMQEEEAQIKLAQATNEYLQEQEQEEKIRGSLESTLADFCSKQQDIIVAETLKIFYFFIDKLKEDLCQQSQRTRLALEHREQCLKQLEDAVKQRKLVERLKEKSWQDYQQQLLQEEQKYLDELGVQTFYKSS